MFDSQIFAYFATRRPGEGGKAILAAKKVSTLREAFVN
jgi:hypothetical protein